jgi:hypothetical protein
MSSKHLTPGSPVVRWTASLVALPALSVRQPWAWLIVNGTAKCLQVKSAANVSQQLSRAKKAAKTKINPAISVGARLIVIFYLRRTFGEFRRLQTRNLIGERWVEKIRLEPINSNATSEPSLFNSIA